MVKWFALCVLVVFWKDVKGDIQDDMTEIIRRCCNDGSGFARSHAEQDCSSSQPVPSDVPSSFGSLCIVARAQCCKEYFQKKGDCDTGIETASNQNQCNASKTFTKVCCDECARGTSIGLARGSAACVVRAHAESAEELLSDDAYIQCCMKAAKEDHHSSISHPATVSKKEKREGTIASLCEDYAPNELCAHHCIPVPGSYRCECNPGFRLMTDGRNCREVVKNRCKPTNPCQHKCNDNGVDVMCSCKRGYELMTDGKSCQDINECQLDIPVCLPSTQCHNIQGSYRCIPIHTNKQNSEKGQCPPGFAKNFKNNACDDINECKLPNPPCPAYICENTVGGYKCGGVSGDPVNLKNNPPEVVEDRCPSGFALKHGNCEDVDECALSKDDCNPLSQHCVNTHSSFFCQDKVSRNCRPGFKVNLQTGICEDINECEEEEGLCRTDQICVNQLGQYDCKPKLDQTMLRKQECPDGMRMNPATFQCDDIDECVEGTHLCDQHQNCLNTNGSYVCHCKLGYELDTFTGACVDVNECATGQHDCYSGSQRCDNTVGSFLCIRITSCGTGYILQHSTGNCEDVDECALGTHNCARAGPEFQCMNIAGSFRCVRKRQPTTTTAAPEYEYEYYDSDEEIDGNTTTADANNTAAIPPPISNPTPEPTQAMSTSSTTEIPTTPKEEPRIEDNSVIPESERGDKQDKPRPEVSEPPQPQFTTPTFSPSQTSPQPEEPRYQPEQPSYQPEERRYQPEERRHQPEEPRHQPEQPRYQPEEPRHQPEDPRQPEEPIRQPEQPRYQPEQPRYQPEQPRYKPEEPRQPEEPRYQTEQPRYQPEEPRYQPQQPSYRPEESEDKPTENPSSSERPEYRTQITYTEAKNSEQPEIVYREPSERPQRKETPDFTYYETRNEPDTPISNEIIPGVSEKPTKSEFPTEPEPRIVLETEPTIVRLDTKPVVPTYSPYRPTEKNEPAPPHEVYVSVGGETATVTGDRREDGSVDRNNLPNNRWNSTNGKSIPCPPGFEANDYGGCFDIDECVTNRHSCSGLTEACRNTIGGYLCDCAAGFRRDQITGACDVITLSSTTPLPPIFQPDQVPYIIPSRTSTSTTTELPPPPPPPTTPITTPVTLPPTPTTESQINKSFWGYKDDRFAATRPFYPRFWCDAGYMHNQQTGRCEDINECTNGVSNCASVEICVNTQGGYRCECPPHWELDQVRHRCVPAVRHGIFPPGFGNEPVDQQETVSNVDLVPEITHIEDRGTVLNCPWGYRVGDDQNCVDVDECATGEAECGVMQICTNQPGGYTCSCPQGHRLLKDHECEDVDECAKAGNVSICSHNADCVNTVGSYQCRCHSGFRFAPVNDKVCMDVDECSESRSGSLCQHRCNNVWGSYRCSCHRGYRLNSDNRTCSDVDECEQFKSRMPCVGKCINEPGSYRCACPSGYRLSEDKRSCIDIDECEIGEATCQTGVSGGTSHVCFNTRGSYRCQRITCPPGYQLESKHRCTKTERICAPGDWECAHQPSTISYNFITFVSNLFVPESNVNLFTMRGPTWPYGKMKFELHLRDVNAPPSVKKPADINAFLLVQKNNEAVMSLVRPLEGPQSIELELSMELYNREQFGGTAVAKIFIYVSEYEF